MKPDLRQRRPRGPCTSGILCRDFLIVSWKALQIESPKGVCRLHIACPAPLKELCNIDAPVRSFAVVHPGLGPAQPLTQLTLGQPRVLTQALQERGNGGVMGSMLGFGRHVKRLSFPAPLTLFPCQVRMGE